MLNTKTRSIESDMVAYFDVDGTLITWDAGPEDEDAFNLGGVWVRPHRRHIQELLNHKARNHAVIVWSAGGHQWAREACEMLGIEGKVDLFLTKPTWFYDDLAPAEFMTNRIYHKEVRSE